jgi:hypothetical protein
LLTGEFYVDGFVFLKGELAVVDGATYSSGQSH